MDTIYDWVTVALFAALAVIFLQRSMTTGDEPDPAWHYLPPAAGCAAGNYFGNQGEHVLAIALLISSIGYSLFALKLVKLNRQ